MDNPNFTFVIGDPAKDATGRSVEGRVFLAENSWRFEADLMRRFSPTPFQFHPVRLSIERSFNIFEFAFFYTMVSSEEFETNKSGGRIRAASRSDFPLVRAISETGFKTLDRGRNLSAAFLGDIAHMEDQLKRVRKSELLELAFSRLQSNKGENGLWRATS